MTHSLTEIFGILLVLTGILDAFKYSLQAFKVHQQKSSRSMSRKFVVMAIGNDLVKIIYSILILDPYIFLSSILALACMFHLWWMIYVHYPYKYKNLQHFKRPNMLQFTVNACIPNNLRKHL